MSNFGPEWSRLTAAQQRAVRQAIAECERTGQSERIHDGGNAEAYAYPNPGGGTAWGYDGGENGYNIARGVKR